MPLNDKQIKAFKPDVKPYKKTDGEGMYLLIQPNGGKYWRMKYRFAGKEKVLAFGTYPDIPLIEARRKREEAKALLQKGIDPMAKRIEEKANTIKRQEQTFQTVAEKWYELRTNKLAAKTLKNIRNRLDKHLYPTIGHLPIAEIRRFQLIGIGELMNEAGIYEEAKKTIQTAGQIFDFAILKELIEHNPANGVTQILASVPAVHHPALPQSEVKDFYKALLTTGAEQATKHALLITMLTGARSEALRLSKWEHIDFDNKTWYMPAENMKMGNDFLMPLSEWVIEILKERHQSTGTNQYIFPADKKGGAKRPYMSSNAINRFIVKMGYDGQQANKSKVVAHGFRSLMTDVCLENGFSPALTKKALAHTERDKTFAAYYRTDMIEERRKMACFYSDWLMRHYKQANKEIIEAKIQKLSQHLESD